MWPEGWPYNFSLKFVSCWILQDKRHTDVKKEKGLSFVVFFNFTPLLKIMNLLISQITRRKEKCEHVVSKHCADVTASLFSPYGDRRRVFLLQQLLPNISRQLCLQTGIQLCPCNPPPGRAKMRTRYKAQLPQLGSSNWTFRFSTPGEHIRGFTICPGYRNVSRKSDGSRNSCYFLLIEVLTLEAFVDVKSKCKDKVWGLVEATPTCLE